MLLNICYFYTFYLVYEVRVILEYEAMKIIIRNNSEIKYSSGAVGAERNRFHRTLYLDTSSYYKIHKSSKLLLVSSFDHFRAPKK